jgi:hypothetical protein
MCVGAHSSDNVDGPDLDGQRTVLAHGPDMTVPPLALGIVGAT